MTMGNRVRNATFVAASVGLLAVSAFALPASAEVVINEGATISTVAQHHTGDVVSVSPVHHLGWHRQ